MKDALARKWISGIIVGSGFMPTTGGTMTGQLLSAAGTAGAPGIAGAGDADTGMNWPAANTLAWSTGGVEGMRLDTSGNVGIGTGAYALGAKLDVKGGVLGGTAGDEVNVQRSTIPSSSGGSVARLLTTLRRISNGTTWATTEMRLRGVIDSTEMSYISVTLPGAGGMAFGTGFGSPTERMRLDANGNVGIGTSSPGYKLDVSATGNISGQFKTSGSINALFLADAGTTAESLYIGTVGNDFRVVTGSNEIMRVTSAGNVGIGTATPGYKLHVLGNFGIAPGVGTTVTPANNADLVIETTSNTTLTFKLKGSDGVVRTGTVALA